MNRMVLVGLALAMSSPASSLTVARVSANPLATLPSQAGPHVEKIKALGDNAWLNLGSPTPDPKWGREGAARGRSWGSKMAAAPDLGGAFFCGTGVHGAVKSDGHYMDDLWFYDASAHRWIGLYPGASKETRLRLDQHGFEVTEQGDHIPISYLSHAYNNTTYNPDLRLYHIMWTQCPWWSKAVPQRWEWLNIPREKQTYGNVGSIIPLPRHPLFWDVRAGKWERKLVEGSGPGGRFEGVTEYIPSLKKTLYTHQGTTWFYDYAANTWTAGARVPASVAGIDANGCFDTKRERVYVARGKGFAYYDVKLEKWQAVNGPGQPDTLGGTNNAQLHFDTANGIILWHRSHGSIAIYDPEANQWTDLGNTCPDVSGKRMAMKVMLWHGFYDARLNVHFFYLAGDSSHVDATMLAYRYKNVKK